MESNTPITDALFMQVSPNNYANPSGVSTNRLQAEFSKLETDRAELIAALEWLSGATETYLQGPAVARMNNLTAALRETRNTLVKVNA